MFKYDFYRVYNRYPKITDIIKIIRNHNLLYLLIFRALSNYNVYRLDLLPLKLLQRHMMKKYGLEIDPTIKIGKGFYLVHAFNITINTQSVIGKNVNIYKGATIGQESRGKRKGTPIIGDNVYIGINSTVVGKITIGDNVLVAANSFVNVNVPSNSIVFGNPCKIVPNNKATARYINSKV